MSKLRVTIDDQVFEVEVRVPPDADGDVISVTINGIPAQVQVSSLAGPERIDWAVVDNRPYELEVDHDLRWVRSSHGRHTIEIRDMEASVTRPASADGRIKAPIPGLIARVLAEPGEPIEAGQPVLVLEAMKMENEIRAPRSGTLSTLNVRPGQAVRLQEVLAEIT